MDDMQLAVIKTVMQGSLDNCWSVQNHVCPRRTHVEPFRRRIFYKFQQVSVTLLTLGDAHYCSLLPSVFRFCTQWPVSLTFRQPSHNRGTAALEGSCTLSKNCMCTVQTRHRPSNLLGSAVAYPNTTYCNADLLNAKHELKSCKLNWWNVFVRFSRWCAMWLWPAHESDKTSHHPQLHNRRWVLYHHGTLKRSESYRTTLSLWRRCCTQEAGRQRLCWTGKVDVINERWDWWRR